MKDTGMSTFRAALHISCGVHSKSHSISCGVIKANQSMSSKSLALIKGCHPPRKRSAHNELIAIILAYSPRKNNANPILAYSTLYPATSSASASGKSKGARLVSAKHEIKNINAIGRRGKTNHPSFWEFTISVKFNDPARRITDTRINPRETSYDTIWAAERKAPKKAYLELEDHPAIIIPYTPNEDIANIYNSPTDKSAITAVELKGIAAHDSNANMKVPTGAARKRYLFDVPGIRGSFKRSLSPSARG